MGNLTFENFLFQQGYHRGDWLLRVTGRKGGGRGEPSCLSDFEGQNIRLWNCYERGSRVGWPAKGLCVQLGGPFAGRHTGMSSEIQFGLVY
jgi:hypothetical protein